MVNSSKKKKAKDLDKDFDKGKSVLEMMKKDTVEIKKVNVDFPLWMVEALDIEAQRLGIPRQAVIKFLVDKGLKKASNE